MIQEMLHERKLPDLLTMNDGKTAKTPDDWRARRRELIDLLSREEYGYTPKAPDKVEGIIVRSEPTLSFAGKATHQRVDIRFETPKGLFSFPIDLLVPVSGQPAPVFVNIAFRSDVPDRYLPVEEIIDRGYAIATFNYKDVSDDSEKLDGLAEMYPIDPKTGWGKIGMWAFAASRVLDYLESRDDIDATRACVTGHSRLGKTALWCGAQDERFGMVVSNCSGCSGAAITRGKVGESLEAIANRFPYWFCGNYQAWKGREWEAPFDQHMLLALVAPRRLCVCSAQEDEWADPTSEFLACVGASPAWTLLRVPAFRCADRLPENAEYINDGGVFYHVRAGRHFYSRTDWLFQMACRDRYGL